MDSIRTFTTDKAGKTIEISRRLVNMERIYKSINTEVGYIQAKRDAIHLDSLKQENNTLLLMGEVYAKWCEKKPLEHKWYKYSLTINGVKEYKAINIEDYYKEKINTPSSFSEVIEKLSSKADLKTIIIETYDWAYIIVCKGFIFSIIDYR